MAKAGRLSSRYLWAKFTAATDAVMNAMNDPAKQAAHGGLMQVFSEAYNRQLTQIIGITGAAMAPALNTVSVCCNCSSGNEYMASRVSSVKLLARTLAQLYTAMSWFF